MRPPRPDGRPGRRLGYLVLLLSFLALALGLPGTRASANTESAVKIGIGQTVTKSYSDLVGDDGEGAAYQQAGNPNYTSNAQDPSDCDPLPSCDDIPVVLDVPKADLVANNNLLLRVSITYQSGPGAPTPLGTETENTVAGSLWDNPIPTKGATKNGQDGSCFGDPCVINQASPDTTTFSLLADQIAGAADAFQLTLSLVDVGSGASGCVSTSSGPVCGGSPSASGSPAAGGSSAAPAPMASSGAGSGALPPAASSASLPSPSSIGLALPSFQVQSGGPTPLLAQLSQVQIGSVLGVGGKALRQGSFLGIPAARPASSLAVSLSLLTTPVLLGAGYVILTRRRRGIGV